MIHPALAPGKIAVITGAADGIGLAAGAASLVGMGRGCAEAGAAGRYGRRHCNVWNATRA